MRNAALAIVVATTMASAAFRMSVMCLSLVTAPSGRLVRGPRCTHRAKRAHR
jgi:hypothetical protein